MSWSGMERRSTPAVMSALVGLPALVLCVVVLTAGTLSVGTQAPGPGASLSVPAQTADPAPTEIPDPKATVSPGPFPTPTASEAPTPSPRESVSPSPGESVTPTPRPAQHIEEDWWPLAVAVALVLLALGTWGAIALRRRNPAN